MTSAEYAYAIRDLTGVEVKVGVDASSDSVGGEGFANFGDVQFVQDAVVERYLEAAKQVADHAVIGSGPLAFYTDPGKTGLELSALERINELYRTRGFRVVSGEGGRPFGFERYAKAFYVAWHYKHRAALGDPGATLRGLAAKEGITGRFAEHIFEVVNRTGAGYPSRDMIDAWQKLEAPTADTAASMAQARTAADALTKKLVTWPSWFFARGDLAAGGAGDESPLVFDDTTLTAESTHAFTYPLNRRFRRPMPDQPPRVRDRLRPLDGAPDLRRPQQGQGHAGRGLAQPARRAAHPGLAARPLRAGRHHAQARAGADPQDLPPARAPARERDRPPAVRRESRRHAGRPERLRGHGGAPDRAQPRSRGLPRGAAHRRRARRRPRRGRSG